MNICANRGCQNLVSAAHFTKCPPCLLGGPRLARQAAELAGCEALPPLAPVVGGFAFRIPGRPLAWNNALVRHRGRPYLSDEAREYKRAVALHAVRARPPGWDLSPSFALELRCCFANSRADADGPIKLIQDALSGVVWHDDRQVRAVMARKEIDKGAPRVEVVVRIV